MNDEELKVSEISNKSNNIISSHVFLQNVYGLSLATLSMIVIGFSVPLILFLRSQKILNLQKTEK